MRKPRLRVDLAVVLVYAVLSIAFFWPTTLGGKTLLPADNAFSWAPWASKASVHGIEAPHNDLLSDLYLQNYPWKLFLRQCIRERELPLWNPYILGGQPFLAAGQHSAMYPLSAIFYLLPLSAAFGYFAALHLFFAGALTYLFARTLRMRQHSAFISGLIFMFSGFMVTRQVFPMIVAAAVWLPLILSAIELLARQVESGTIAPWRLIPAVGLGSIGFGLTFLAGHAEMYYYVALISGAFALWRLVQAHRRGHTMPHTMLLAAAMAFLALLGLGLGAGQWLPLLKLVQHNFRVGSASLAEVRGWAFPPRRIVSLLVPDFFGNPAHHGYRDIFTWQWTPASLNALGEPIDRIYWGIKNYVEGAGYVGTLAPVLAVIGSLDGGRRRSGRHVLFFVGVAVLSLTFVFGTPLYALVYALPGLNQVHSPFRWVYPYTLCVAVLAGLGAEVLIERADGTEGHGRTIRGWLARSGLPIGALAGGLGLVVLLGFLLGFRESAARGAGALLPRLALATQAFRDGRMFLSYQVRNLAIVATAASLGGALLVIARRIRRRTAWAIAVGAVIVGELFYIGRPFFPAVDPALVAPVTPAIELLRGDLGEFRISSFGADKTFNANAAMWYGIEDVRGYDSIILRDYAQMMNVIQPQSELQYNRIAPIYQHYPDALGAPLMDALNVRFVVSAPEREIDAPGYTLVYDGEMRVYERETALPRAYLVPSARVIVDTEEREQVLRTFDPRQTVILENASAPTLPQPPEIGALPPASVNVIAYGINEVTVRVATGTPGYLVLADTYFSGWQAFMRPSGAEPAELHEAKTDIYRANGALRAVYVPAGDHTVRFKYSPDEVKFGLYISFLSGMILLLCSVLWLWLRFTGNATEDGVERRVTKNTLAPIGLSLANKVIDMAFAMLMLRILGTVDAGQYALAIVVIGWFDILTNFGLNTLVTREVAKDREHANRYLSNTVAIRMALWVAAIPLLAGFFGLRWLTKPLHPATVAAIALFGLALIPSNIAASISAVFNAYERMELPASITTLTTLLRVILGTVALVAGTGYVGLAAVSIVVNMGTMVLLYVLLRRTLFRPHLDIDWRFQRRMLSVSYPLMINLLLATLFFKVSMLLLDYLVPEPRVLGWYSAAYKYVDAVQVIPAYFTMAIFPLMARFASDDRDALLRAYRLATKLLVIVALPCAFAAWALARPLVGVLAGSQYLPQAADILRVMIWYMPIGFINSVTQYVLIALDQQRFLTRAFAIGLAFNVLVNLFLIRSFGYMAAAYVAVVSEVALLVPFCVGIHRHLTPIPWVRWLWKPLAGAVPVIALVLLLPESRRAEAVLAGMVAYMVSLLLLGALTREERAALGRVLPVRGIWAKARAHWAERQGASATETSRAET